MVSYMWVRLNALNVFGNNQNKKHHCYFNASKCNKIMKNDIISKMWLTFVRFIAYNFI